jgi:solute carrier family 39 (zinc transporter), member 1/2/3
MENNTILDSDNYLQKDVAKILAMITLGVGSFVVGILPAFITENQRRRFPLVISILMCFGAGVLLATALVHILPEVITVERLT